MSAPQYLRTPNLEFQDTQTARQDLARYFNVTYSRYESLFETLAEDAAYFDKSIPQRHPLIFYYGHTATFFVNKLMLCGLIKQRINPEFESMFAIGVDEMGWDDVDNTNYDWPSVAAVQEYRDQVRQLVNDLIETAPLTLPISWESPWWMIIMGIEHEQIHLETSSVLIRQQSLNLVQDHADWSPWPAQNSDSNPAPENSLVDVPGGSVELGKAQQNPVYGWDNEYGAHKADLKSFHASKYLVSNREFLPFVEDSGYANDAVWSEEGLQWRKFAKAKVPGFWLMAGERWKLRLMTEVVDIPWAWPVEVNCHEAKAFCNWKAQQSGEPVRLPTEEEWYRIYDCSGINEPVEGKPAKANLHLDYSASSCRVDQFPQGEFYDVVGNVWQWTETAIYPFEGFRVHPYYDDFTMPTMDGKHNLIKGGSWISSGNETQRSARYAFRRHFYQHAGFRYVVADAPEEQELSHYEDDKMLSEYAEFHFGDSYYGVENFPKALADIAIGAMGDKPALKALDIGCAVGRASFELAKHFDEVRGIDFSTRLIGLGVQLAEQGVVRYSIADEGALKHHCERRLNDLGLQKDSHKVTFTQGDACNLKSSYTGYDLVLAANLIDRLYDPVLFLGTIHERINVGGILMITSPYTWLEEHTKKDNWLGGYKSDGESVTTLDGLKSVLLEHFDLLRPPQQIPFVIRETSRKFQHTLSDVTLWVRK